MSRRGYSCQACGRILDEETFPPKKLKVVLADPIDHERGDERSVFLCPDDSDLFVRFGAVKVTQMVKTVV
jgi:hypothetical protein